MAAEYLLELYYPVGVLLEFKPESCEERTGGVSRRSVGSAVTWIFMPEERITFGILTFLGSAMLLLMLLKPLLEHIPSVLGFLEMQCCSFL